jgi:hypothetical protein
MTLVNWAIFFDILNIKSDATASLLAAAAALPDANELKDGFLEIFWLLMRRGNEMKNARD